MELEKQIAELREEAAEVGVFFPIQNETEILDAKTVLHQLPIENRRVLTMPCGKDATADGAPSDLTVKRYSDAILAQPYGIVVLEPAAIHPDARETEADLVFAEENAESFRALMEAIKRTSKDAHGFEPVIVALLNHAGHHALKPAAFDHSTTLPTNAPLLADEELTKLLIACSDAAKLADRLGVNGIGINAADRSLFGESLAAFHRDGKFGGDFDDRTRFVRDCYTAMKMVVSEKMFFTIRLCLSDGIPQPDGWCMAFEDSSAPDLYESTLLLQILRTLYQMKLVICTIGIPDINWMCEPVPESALIRYSRLCTCVAMLDSDLQENVQLVIPELNTEEIPFANLASGMIAGEFATFGGFLSR